MTYPADIIEYGRGQWLVTAQANQCIAQVWIASSDRPKVSVRPFIQDDRMGVEIWDSEADGKRLACSYMMFQ